MSSHFEVVFRLESDDECITELDVISRVSEIISQYSGLDTNYMSVKRIDE